jgi:hypothetical protein
MSRNPILALADAMEKQDGISVHESNRTFSTLPKYFLVVRLNLMTSHL